MYLKTFILSKMHLFSQGWMMCVAIRGMVLVEKAWALKKLMALGSALKWLHGNSLNPCSK